MVIRAELPGFNPDQDVRVEVIDGELVITAQRSESHKENGHHLHRSEFRYGSFTRSIPIPVGVDESKIAATYKDGVLEVRVALPAESSSEATHQIEIKHS
jgi:HSP20 family protein